MSHTVVDPRFETLIYPYQPVDRLGSGYTFTEGPLWHPKKHYILI